MTKFLKESELPEVKAFAEAFMVPSKSPLDGTLEWANVDGRWHCLRDVARYCVSVALAVSPERFESPQMKPQPLGR